MRGGVGRILHHEGVVGEGGQGYIILDNTGGVGEGRGEEHWHFQFSEGGQSSARA